MKSTSLLAAAGIALLSCAPFSACDDPPPLEPTPRAAESSRKRDPPAPADAPDDERGEAPPAEPAPEAERIDEPRPEPEPGKSADPNESPDESKEGADVPPPSPDDRWLKAEQYDATFEGKKLRMLRIGKPGGREVLLLHGGRFNCRTWLELGTLEFLAKNGCRAVAIDLPGYGASTGITTAPADFLFLALPHLDLKKPVIVFPSMSGMFAFPFAVAHPELIAGLVPVAPVEIDEHAKKLKGNELPALIVWGEHDTVIPISKADVLRELLPNSQKLVIPGASHPCYLDQPQQFHAALLKFVRTLPAPKK